MKPSDFPRDLRFRVPGPAFIENGVAHLRSYQDVQRVLLDGDNEEFNHDISFWSPPGERHHLSLYFLAVARRRADGSPGRHDLLRSLIEPYFRVRKVKSVVPMVRGHARDLVREVVAKGTGEFDLAAELAYPLALCTIISLVGLPPEREGWISDRIGFLGRIEEFVELERESPDIEEFLWELIHARRARPEDAMLDMLIGHWEAGTITDLELLGFVWGLCILGFHDPGTNIANAFCLLDEFDLLDQARAHLDDEQWLRRAGEEILRFGTPFPSSWKVAVKDVTLDCGLTIPAGSPIRVWFSAANRDEAINGGNRDAAGPEVFDVTRWPNRHLAFGMGVYHCLGAELARIEARVALQTVLAALPGLHLARDQPFERHAGFDDGVDRATFRFDQSAAADREMLL